jgi:hypothetical protein
MIFMGRRGPRDKIETTAYVDTYKIWADGLGYPPTQKAVSTVW